MDKQSNALLSELLPCISTIKCLRFEFCSREIRTLTGTSVGTQVTSITIY